MDPHLWRSLLLPVLFLLFLWYRAANVKLDLQNSYRCSTRVTMFASPSLHRRLSSTKSDGHDSIVVCWEQRNKAMAPQIGSRSDPT